MSNVITPEGRKAVRSIYRARFMIAGGLVMIATATGAFLAILPSYLALHVSNTPADALSDIPLSKSDHVEIAKAQMLLGALQPLLSATTTPSEAISLALDLRGEGVRIDRIAYSADAPAVITISGYADTPTQIDAYQKALSVEGIFKNVSVPVGDLVGAPDGRFSMTIQGDF